MAQTIKLKRSSVAGNVPGSSDLSLGEIALNTADGAVYIKKGNNDIVAVADNDILHIDTTNSRVGIGDTSPDFKLAIRTPAIPSGSTYSWPLDLSRPNTDNRGLTFGVGSSGGPHAIAAHNGDVHIGQTFGLDSNNLPQFYETLSVVHDGTASIGKVGIGTTSPDAKLRIDQNVGTVGLKVTGGSGGTDIAQFIRDVGATASVTIGATNADPQIKFTSPSNTFSVGVNSNTFEIADNNALGTNARFSITNTGNVGIGTTSPDAKLQVEYNGGHTSGNIAITHSSLDLYNPLEANTDEKGSILTFSDNYLDSSSYSRTTRAAIKGGTDTVGNTADGFLAFYTDASGANSMPERMRIDNSGNLLVGTTTAPNTLLGASSTQGVAFNGGQGYLVAAASGQATAYFNRQTNDGTITEFRKDGSTVGAIKIFGSQLYIENTSDKSGLRLETNAILPRKNQAMANGTVGLGNSAYRFSTLYLSGTANVGGLNINSAYTFPTADGSANQVLQTDGSGNLTFGSAAGGGVSISNNVNNRVLTGDGTNANAEANLTFDGTTLTTAGVFTLTNGSETNTVMNLNGSAATFLEKDTGTDFYIANNVSDRDIFFRVNDGGSNVVALALDASEGGNAAFAGTISSGAITSTGAISGTTGAFSGTTTVGGNVTGVALNVHATNTAGSSAVTAVINMKGYEGRGIGTFYQDTTYSGEEWYSGLPYNGSFNCYQIGYDEAGSQAEYSANSIARFTSSGEFQMGTTTVIDASRNITAGTISSGNITTTGYLRGPSTFTIDPATHGDDTGTLVIAGNLQVDGTTTTINSTTLTVDDKNITLASGSANAAAANGAGITVDGASANITYTSTTDEWDFNKSIHVSGASGSGIKINSGGAIVGGGASGGDTQLMYWGGGAVYYGRSSAGGTVSGHEFRVGGITKLNVNSSGNTVVSGNIVVSGTVDGVDIAARDAILTSTTTTAGAALPKAGGTMTGDINLNTVDARFRQCIEFCS